MLQNDQPIATQTEDILGRVKFAQELGQNMLNWHNNDASIVIALNGKWGSGKSSIIQLACNNIRGQLKKGKTQIIFFNPWMFKGQGKLSRRFFIEIAAGLQEKSVNQLEKAAELAKSLSNYGDSLDSVTAQAGLQNVKSYPAAKTLPAAIVHSILTLGLVAVFLTQNPQSTWLGLYNHCDCFSLGWYPYRYSML